MCDGATSAYLSVISHDDQLHILGRSLDMALMLQRADEGRNAREREEGKGAGMIKRGEGKGGLMLIGRT